LKTLGSVEQCLAQIGAGDFLGVAPGLFECVLIPQLYNARRFGFDVEAMFWMRRIEGACLELPAFIRAHPGNQPDCPKDG
jgi:maleylpyruvate isomerase